VRVARTPVAVLVAVTALGACAAPADRSMPACEAGPRLAIIAQSVPDAAYVPCIADLPTGWSFTRLDVDDEGTTIDLDSDRADRGVEVALTSTCDVGRATPIDPSDEGTRSYQLVESIDPRYAGQIIDVFPGGCVVSAYDFERGPHVALITELQQAVELYSRRELRQQLDTDLDITLDP
jgi:hypothetical protein